MNICEKCGVETDSWRHCANCTQADCLDSVELHVLLVLQLLRDRRVDAVENSAEIARELELALDSSRRAVSLADDAERERAA
jgi:hypothetical protein